MKQGSPDQKLQGLIALAVVGSLLSGCDRRPIPGAQDSVARPPRSIDMSVTTRIDDRSLLATLADSLRPIKPAVTSLQLIAIRYGYSNGPYYALAIIRGPGFGTSPTTKAGYIYAVVAFDSTLTKFEGVVDTFPSLRGDDYSVWFRPGEGELVVCGHGSSYGDQKMRREIFVDSTGRHTDSVVVKLDQPPAEFSSDRGCGVSGYMNG